MKKNSGARKSEFASFAQMLVVAFSPILFLRLFLMHPKQY